MTDQEAINQLALIIAAQNKEIARLKEENWKLKYKDNPFNFENP